MRIPRLILVLWYLPPMAVVLFAGALVGLVVDLADWMNEQLRITWEHLDSAFWRRWRR